MIGHSLGGIITRYFVEFLDDKKKVQKAALVGTPNHGTYGAYVYPGEAPKEVRPNTDLLNTLNSKEL